jgi:hypothetical protein
VILYQVPYILDPKQFGALRAAAGAVGDVEGFYVHAVERSVGWAVFVSESWCAAAAGTGEFVEALSGAWPSFAEADGEIFGPQRQVEAYLTVLAHVGVEDAVMQWLPRFLVHIYGQGEAQRLVTRHLTMARSGDA